MLFQTLYTSRARLPITDRSNAQILLGAVAHNARHALTGFLFRSPDHFLQLLEGPRAELQDVMAQIMLDSRHDSLRCWPVVEVPQRLFGDWTMGLASGLAQPDLDVIRAMPRTAESLALLRPTLREMATPYFPDRINID